MDKNDPFDSAPTPSPPHAPRPRPLAEEPLAVVDRLIADEASALGDEQVWEFYAQLEDEIALEQGSVTLANRLATCLGGEYALELITCGSSAPSIIEGVLAQVGNGWITLITRQCEFVINIDSVASVMATSDGSLPIGVAGAPRNATWASLLRRCAESKRPIVVHYRAGSPLSGRVVLAARDHFDIAVTSSVSQSQTVIRTVAISSVIAIDMR